MRRNPSPPERLRALRAGLPIALVAGAVLAGAGAPVSAGTATTEPREPAADAAVAVFPATVETAFGPVEIVAAPERVVALDFGAVDALLALGIEPAVVSLGADIDPNLPWLDGLIDPSIVDESLFDGRVLNIEAIADAEPDLIVGAWWAVDEVAFEQLNAIAPTVTSATPGNEGWAARLDLYAAAVGRGDRAAELHAELDALGDELAAQVPQLAGRTYNYTGFSLDYGGFFWGNGSWLQPFGLVPNHNQDDSQTSAAVSFENMDLLDADVWGIYLVNPADRELLEGDPRFAQLPSAEHELVLWIDQPLANATNNAGPLSLRWALGRVVVELAAADVDG